MNTKRLARLPNRIQQDLKIIRLAKNWRTILVAKASNRPFFSIRLRNGIVLNSPPEVSLNFLFQEIWLDEFYSPPGYEIKSNETVVDIGANIGVFAMYAATRAENVRVFSYEPFPKNAEFFRANQADSRASNVVFRATAVADTPGRRTLRVKDSWILHSLTDKNSNEKGIEVECVSLDQIFEDIEHCDLLKLDCEGGEYEILYSASNESLGKIKRIVCEFNVLNSDEKNGEALNRFLLDNGFIVDMLRSLDDSSGFICARRHDR